MNTKYLFRYLNSFFATDRAALLSIGLFLVLSAPILLSMAVGTIPPVMA